MNLKNLGISLIALVCLITILSLDLVLIPLVLGWILSWFGVGLSYLQCLIIIIFFNVLTYGMRKRG